MKLVLDCHATIMNGLLKTFYMMVRSNYELWPIYEMNLYAHLMILGHGHGKQRQLLQPNELYYLAEEFLRQCFHTFLLLFLVSSHENL